MVINVCGGGCWGEGGSPSSQRGRMEDLGEGTKQEGFRPSLLCLPTEEA